MHSQRQLAGASSTRYVNPPATNIFGILNPSYSVFPPSSLRLKDLDQLHDGLHDGWMHLMPSVPKLLVLDFPAKRPMPKPQEGVLLYPVPSCSHSCKMSLLL